MRNNILPLSLSVAMLFCACNPNQESAPEYDSTIANPDGTVTFQYYNPHATEVKVDVQFAGRHDMQKDEQSQLWTCTLGPAEPDMYPYCFIVDGVSVMDPQNQQYFPNEGFKNSLLDIPSNDGTPLTHSIQNVPHGNVEYISYYSNAISTYNNAIVYLPPSYYESDQSYPVFYLISGTTDTEEVYYKVGRMNHILDNLIAQGEAEEMIIVLPYGNPGKLASASADQFKLDLFGKDLNEDLMPYVESHYRTINDSDHRAIGGFSRGGNQGLMNGLTHLDKFSYLCSYSSFTSMELPDVYDKAKETNQKIHLFWTGVGTDDFLYGNARDYTEFLDQKGITAIKEYTDNKFGHTWMNAKYFLAKTLRLLFKPEAAAKAMAEAQPTKAKTGQEQQFTPGVMARLFPKPIISPDFNGKTVTFRFKAETAKEVWIEGEMLENPVLMNKDTAGIWSIELSIRPDIYCYNFVVDGTKVCDPQNMYLAPDKGFKRSVLNMPDAAFAIGSKTCDYSAVRYQMDQNQTQYALIIPNQQEGSIATTIHLVAGRNDTFESWFKIAHANLILDQMIATGQCKPCILMLSEQKAENGINLCADDYPNWSAARKALIDTLKGIK